MTDRTLFDAGPATGNLQERARYVHELLGQHPDGLTASQVGARLHVHLEKPCRCGSDQPCKWASADGLSVLRALRKRKLVKQRRDGSRRWQTGEHYGRGAARPADHLNPETDPFPPGY